jgi:NAD(P)-dependent dehydrogenase (short-subunit alcohol dehydrogenase family)
MGQLEGKTALVTGGTEGIGYATATRFVAEGASVIITGRRQAALDAAVSTIGGDIVGVRSDVSVPSDLADLAGIIRERGRGIDVVFANAGGGGFTALADITRAEFDQTFGINVAGTLFTVQAVLELLNDGASIVLAGSTAASNGTPAFSVYAASKAAIRSFGRTWAAELAPRGIRVNTIVPGPTDTPGLRGLAPAGQEDGLVASIASGVPMGRAGTADEIANGVLFLASRQSSFMTGGELFIDGGSEQL